MFGFPKPPTIGQLNINDYIDTLLKPVDYRDSTEPVDF